jgi:hypothetical protein
VIRGVPGVAVSTKTAVSTKPVQPEWKIRLALVALAAMLALGVGLPLSTLLTSPPGASSDAATDDGLVPLVPGALGGSGPDGDASDADSGFRRGDGPASKQAPVAAAPASAGVPAIGVTVPAVPPSPAGSTPAPTPVPNPVKLTASYTVVGQTDSLGAPTGYLVHVTVRNPGQVTVSGWRVRFRVPDGELVTSVSGARYRQDVTQILFGPAGNAVVPPNGTVEFTFTLGGVVAGPPTRCAIDGSVCS